MKSRPVDPATGALVGPSLTRRTALGHLGRGGAVAAAVASIGGVGSRASAQEVTVEANASGSVGPEGEETSGDVIVRGADRDAFPDVSAETTGRLRRRTDGDRGLWLETEDQWVSLSGEEFDVRTFGAVGDGTTDDWGAFEAAIEAMSSALEADSTSAYGRTLRVPPGTYRLAQTLVLDKSIRLVGTSGSGLATDSILLVDAGIVGILVAEADPILTGQPGRRGDGALIERLHVVAAPARPPAEGDAPSAEDVPVEVDTTLVHGIWLRAGATLRDVCVEAFSGDGIRVAIGVATQGEGGSGSGGVDPAWHVANSWVAGCGGSGLAVEGSGVGLAELVSASGNGGWGFRDTGSGTSLVGCRAAGNAAGSFTTEGAGNRSVLAGCVAAVDQPRASLADGTIVAGGTFADGYQGGNAWTADASRMLLNAQAPGSGEDGIQTVPTLQLRGAAGQTEPHLRVGDPRGGRLVEVDAAGRLLVGPADLTSLAAGDGDQPAAVPVQVQISHPESGQAAVAWVVAGESGGWVASARAYREAGGTDADPTAGGSRLTFQTAGGTGGAIDTLTLREGRAGIGTTTPSPVAILDLASSGHGFLPPRLTGEQRDAIAGVPEGLTIFNTTSKRLNVHDGEQWREVAFTEIEVGG